MSQCCLLCLQRRRLVSSVVHDLICKITGVISFIVFWMISHKIQRMLAAIAALPSQFLLQDVAHCPKDREITIYLDLAIKSTILFNQYTTFVVFCQASLSSMFSITQRMFSGVCSTKHSSLNDNGKGTTNSFSVSICALK